MQTIGPYTQNEIPLDLLHTFDDDTGHPIDISDWTVFAEHLLPDGSIVERELEIADGANGQVIFPFADGDLALTGAHALEIWGGDGTHRLASERFEWWVNDCIAVPPALT